MGIDQDKDADQRQEEAKLEALAKRLLSTPPKPRPPPKSGLGKERKGPPRHP